MEDKHVPDVFAASLFLSQMVRCSKPFRTTNKRLSQRLAEERQLLASMGLDVGEGLHEVEGRAALRPRVLRAALGGRPIRPAA